MPLHTLKITTNLRLHSGFSEAPLRFARQHDVDLVDEVFPETSFKKDPDSEDPYNEDKTVKVKANIHLVQHGAIRLFTERDDDCDWIRSIEMNPSLLLHGAKRHPLTHADVLMSLDVLRTAVAPLLAEPLDAHHIIPGLVGEGESIAFYSAIESEIRIPGILLPCLHRLSHPMTGPAEGMTKTRIQLGNNSDDCVIRFTNAKWETSGPSGTQTVQGIRVKLILRKSALPTAFGEFGTTALVNNTECLIAFPGSSVARVHQMIMSGLEGTYLPVPAEWRDKTQGKLVTCAKAIALISQLTTIPVEELRRLDEQLRDPSDSTRKRLNKDVMVEASRFTPVPVSTLFESAAYAAQELGRTT